MYLSKSITLPVESSTTMVCSPLDSYGGNWTPQLSPSVTVRDGLTRQLSEAYSE